MSVTVMTWSVSRAKVAPSDIRRGCGLHRRALSKCPSPTLWARSSAIFYLLMCLSYLVMRLWWIPGGTGQGGGESRQVLGRPMEWKSTRGEWEASWSIRVALFLTRPHTHIHRRVTFKESTDSLLGLKKHSHVYSKSIFPFGKRGKEPEYF